MFSVIKGKALIFSLINQSIFYRRSRNRYLVNNLAQIASCTYEKDKGLIEKFQTVRVSEMTTALDALDVCQLLKLLHIYMTFFKKPLAPKKLLISWLELYSLERKVDTSPKTAYKVI
jgi:hypothetical protein